MQLRRVNKKIKDHLEEIREEDELIGKFLDELIKRESARGKNWHYKNEYLKLISKATEEWENDVEY